MNDLFSVGRRYASVVVFCLMFGLCPWTTTSTTFAQLGAVQPVVSPSDVGIAGYFRAGDWTPMWVQLTNNTGEQRNVIVQWALSDSDGDRVHAQRERTLAANQSLPVWLYASPPVSGTNSDWQVRVLDAETGDLISAQPVAFQSQIPADTGAIGVTSQHPMGLERFNNKETQHESITLVKGVDPTRLPDRWYGLRMLSTLVWTPDATEPNAAGVSPQSVRALIDWVERGGHLVLIFPGRGEQFTPSPLAPLLTGLAYTSHRGALVPNWLGTEPAATRVDLTTFDWDDATVLHRMQGTGDPVVVARRYGFGRVTLVGVDLTDRRITGLGLPEERAFWWRILGLRSPAFRNDVRQKMIDDDLILNAWEAPSRTDLAEFLPRQLAMRGSFAAALSLAILTFVVYWLIAGPVAYLLLRQRKLVRHAWLVFAGTVGLFTCLCWLGALMLRESATRVEHVSVLDIDATSGAMHVQSWLSLFVPKHGDVHVEITGEDDASGAVFASPGLDGAGEAEFINALDYAVNLASPDVGDIPFRSTSKQFEVDYFKPGGVANDAFVDQWIGPQGYLALKRSPYHSQPLPTGRLAHGLPGALKDVTVIYCNGAEHEPLIWPLGTPDRTWAPQTSVEVAPTSRPAFLVAERGQRKRMEGWLGDRITRNRNLFITSDPNTGFPMAAPPASESKPPKANEVTLAIELLSFFDTLPPPLWWKDPPTGSDLTSTPSAEQTIRLRRSEGRNLDLSVLRGVRCVIVIGYMEAAPLPLPLTVDGEAPPASGWTVVRWISPVDDLRSPDDTAAAPSITPIHAGAME